MSVGTGYEVTVEMTEAELRDLIRIAVDTADDMTGIFRKALALYVAHLKAPGDTTIA